MKFKIRLALCRMARFQNSFDNFAPDLSPLSARSRKIGVKEAQEAWANLCDPRNENISSEIIIRHYKLADANGSVSRVVFATSANK